jgi:hypothetical protein
MGTLQEKSKSGGTMDDKPINRKQVISVLLWTVGSYLVLMLGRIEPAVFLQLGIASADDAFNPSNRNAAHC